MQQGGVLACSRGSAGIQQGECWHTAGESAGTQQGRVLAYSRGECWHTAGTSPSTDLGGSILRAPLVKGALPVPNELLLSVDYRGSPAPAP